MYARTLSKEIKKRLGSGKAIIVVGSRQVEKIALLEDILSTKEYLLLDGGAKR